MEISDQPTRASVPRPSFNAWRNSGAPWIWLNAGAISISLIVVLTLLGLLTVRGLSHFWPATLHEYRYQLSDGTQERIIGQQVNAEFISVNQYRESTGQAAPAGAEQVERWLIKVGNRELLPADFRWLDHHLIKQIDSPVHLVRIERTEWGDMFGTLQGITEAGQPVATGSDASWLALQPRLERAKTLRAEIRALEKGEIGAINHQLERLRLERRKLALQNQQSDEALADIKTREDAQHAQFELLQQRLIELHVPQRRSTGGQHRGRHLPGHFRHRDDGAADVGDGHALSASSPPSTCANMPSQGPLIRAIRIAVNNLAGVPSIVYGVFGLGFFVYFLGGQIDQLFFAEALPAPDFRHARPPVGLTDLALLTVPVVIVATEEGLARIPRSMREGRLAVGATKPRPCGAPCCRWPAQPS
jgi:phosphate transport system permease protein